MNDVQGSDLLSATTMKGYWSPENGHAKSDLSNLSDVALPHGEQSTISKIEFPLIAEIDSTEGTILFENLDFDDSCVCGFDDTTLNCIDDIFDTSSLAAEPDEDTPMIKFPAPIENSHRSWADMVSTKEAKMLQRAADLPLWNAFYTIEAMLSEYKSFRVADDASVDGHGHHCASDAYCCGVSEHCK